MSSVPISYRGQYHYRSGSTKQELKGVALQEFILRKLGKQWDDIIHPTASLNDIDIKAINFFVKKGIQAKRLSEAALGNTPVDVLRNLHLMTDDGLLKVTEKSRRDLRQNKWKSHLVRNCVVVC